MRLLGTLVAADIFLAGAEDLDGVWTCKGASGKEVHSFTIEGRTIHWNAEFKSEITNIGPNSLTTDLAGLGDNLHDFATFPDVGDRLVWSNGDIWAREVKEPVPSLEFPLPQAQPLEIPLPPAQPLEGPSPLDQPLEVPLPPAQPLEGPSPLEQPSQGPSSLEQPSQGPSPLEQPSLGPSPLEQPSQGPSPQEVVASVDGVWTPKDHPGKRIFTIRDAALSGLTVYDTPIVATATSGISAAMPQGVATANVTSNELQWDIDSTWVRASDAQVLEALDGLWTQKDAPGKKLYTIGEGQLEGDDLAAQPLNASAEGAVSAGALAGHVAGSEIRWKGDAGTWIRLSGEDALGALSGLYTEKADPGSKIFTLRSGKVSGPGLRPQEGGELSVTGAGRLATALTQGPKKGAVSGADLRWEGDAGVWVRMTDDQVMGTLSGLWTEKDHQGDRIFNISSGKMSEAENVVPLVVGADGTVQTTVDQHAAAGRYTGDTIDWSGDGVWVPFTGKLALESLEGLYTEKARPGKNIFTIRDGKLGGEDLSATLTARPAGLLTGSLETDLKDGPMAGSYMADEILWEGEAGTWTRYRSQGVLDGIWTEKERPGTHIYSVHSGSVYSKQFGKTDASITVDSAGRVVLGFQGEATRGEVKSQALISWDRGSEWVRMTSEQAEQSLHGFWTSKEDPGKEVYNVGSNKVTGSGLNSTLSIHTNGELAMKEKGATTHGIVNAEEIEWGGRFGTWIRIPMSSVSHDFDGLWTMRSDSTDGSTTGRISGSIFRIVNSDIHGHPRGEGNIGIEDDGTILATIAGEPSKASLLSGDIHWEGGDVWIRLAPDQLLEVLAGFWMQDAGDHIYVLHKDGKVDDLTSDPVAMPWDLVVEASGNLTLSRRNDTDAQGRLLISETKLQWLEAKLGSWRRISPEEVLQGMWVSEEGNFHSIDAGQIDNGKGGAIDVTRNAELIREASADEEPSIKGAILGEMRGGALHFFASSHDTVWRRGSPSEVLVLAAGRWTEKRNPGKHVFTIFDGRIFSDSDDVGVDLSVNRDGSLRAELEGSTVTGLAVPTGSPQYAGGVGKGREIVWPEPVGTWIPWAMTDQFMQLDGYWRDRDEPKTTDTARGYYHIHNGEVSGPTLSLASAAAPLSLGTTVRSGAGMEVSAPIGEGGVMAFAVASSDYDRLTWKGIGAREVVWVRHASIKAEDISTVSTARIAIDIMRPEKDVRTCVQRNVMWQPMDMAGQMMTVEPNISSCMRRCAMVQECAHYTFWETGGFCHIQDVFATVSFNALGYVSGPPGCSLKGGRNVNTSMIMLQGDACWERGENYGAADPLAVGVASTISKQNTAQDCKNECLGFKWCKIWSYDSVTQACFLNTDSAESNVAKLDVITNVAGPPTCPEGVLYYSLKLDGLNFTAILENPTVQDALRVAVRHGVINFRKIVDSASHNNTAGVQATPGLEAALDDEEVFFVPTTGLDGQVFVKLARVDAMPMRKMQKLLTENKDALRLAVLYSLKSDFHQYLHHYAYDVISAHDSQITLRGIAPKPVKCSTSPQTWVDFEGETCASYGKYKLCTEDGKPGVGWHSSWGTFTDFESQGRSAAEACCECGGGTTNDMFPHTVTQIKKPISDLNTTLLSEVGRGPRAKVLGLASDLSGVVLVLGGFIAVAGLTPTGRRWLRRDVSAGHSGLHAAMEEGGVRTLLVPPGNADPATDEDDLIVDAF